MMKCSDSGHPSINFTAVMSQRGNDIKRERRSDLSDSRKP